MEYAFYKNKDTDRVWWILNKSKFGERLFTFDKETIFNLFRDYPYNLTPDQKKIFDEDFPFWKEFFSNRVENAD